MIGVGLLRACGSDGTDEVGTGVGRSVGIDGDDPGAGRHGGGEPGESGEPAGGPATPPVSGDSVTGSSLAGSPGRSASGEPAGPGAAGPGAGDDPASGALLDVDGDGTLDGPFDTDGDGTVDGYFDIDGDGTPDRYFDSFGDGIPDGILHEAPPPPAVPPAVPPTAPPSTTPPLARDLAVDTIRVPATAEPVVDGCGERMAFDGAHLVDGDDATAWRMEGDGTGKRITVELEGPRRVLSVGLVPGFDVVDRCDGTELFHENRRVTQVTWEFDDGQRVRQELIDVATMQRIEVDATTTTIVLHLDGVTADPEHDFSAISELAVRGV